MIINYLDLGIYRINMGKLLNTSNIQDFKEHLGMKDTKKDTIKLLGHRLVGPKLYELKMYLFTTVG